jgi:peptidyl-tRNA hydrolase, PTH1 family
VKLFVGLGNPGARHARNRHNVGWMAVDAIAARHGFAPERAKFEGLLSEGRLGGDRVAILKPETFMNLSGQSVGKALHFFKLTPADVVVFHDELDLPPGRLRVKQGGGHAGHNGLRSLHQHIGEHYGRVRIGIGHPGDKARVAAYVLDDFARDEQEGWLPPLLEAVAKAAPILIGGDPAGFQGAVTRAVAPEKPAAPPKAPRVPRAAVDQPQSGAAAQPATGPFDALRGLARPDDAG